MKSLRNLLLASASSVALASAATAADMPVKAPPAPAVLSWAGPYAGFNVGAAWNNAKFSDLGTGGTLFAFPAGANDPFWSAHKAGITLGGQAGYNWQTGNFVYGVEGDLNWIDGKASASFNPFGPVIVATSNLDWMGTVRGRFGVVYSQILFYGTGGIAFAHFEDAWGFAAAGGNAFAINTTRTGWVAGGGLEYMIAPHWTARVEGLYADFGTATASLFVPGIGTYTSSFRHAVTTARAALNWKW